MSIGGVTFYHSFKQKIEKTENKNEGVTEVQPIEGTRTTRQKCRLKIKSNHQM